MKWIVEKMKLLGVSSHPDYKIAFYLDSLAMITVETQKYGVIEVCFLLFRLIVLCLLIYYSLGCVYLLILFCIVFFTLLCLFVFV